jgi:hypothetical protein
MNPRYFLPKMCLLLLLWSPVNGLLAQPQAGLEQLINSYLQAYPFSPENAFRLATYMELKGHYDPAVNAMSVAFGGIGSLTFYERNCLLRFGQHGVYALDQRRSRVAEVEAMNKALSEVFEQIFLMGNAGLDPGRVRFVERNLARKNIGPFDKILLRHLLLRFGRFDSTFQRYELHTEWLPDLEFAYREYGDRSAHQKPKTPLFIKLDPSVLRGFYLRTHGTVYVNDVDRELLYATGESQGPNVTAFKAFAQKVFTQNTLYLVQAEQKRLAALEIKVNLPNQLAEGELPLIASTVSGPARPRSVQPKGYSTSTPKQEAVHRYHEYHWVPMMLGLLRNKGISVADPDILPYFVEEPYFPFLYELLTPAERAAVDRQITP